MMRLPDVSDATLVESQVRRLFIGAYGFEKRSLGWAELQSTSGRILDKALLFRYKHPKGKNRIQELQTALAKLGAEITSEARYDAVYSHNTEDIVAEKLKPLLTEVDEIVLDISAMTKLLILVSLCKLEEYRGSLRIVYTEAGDYAPTENDYEHSKEEMELIARFPSQGFQSIIRTKCLGSIRMQGQPVSMIAFTSFNEQLVRHMLGTISPHRMFLINGRPPRADYAWREKATQEIHKKLIQQYTADNAMDENGLLHRVASTLDYKDSIHRLEEIYVEVGNYERIICAATGSKMQTVGLFFAKVMHPDIHIEYPTPDSYFVKGMSTGIRTVHEIVIPHFSKFLEELQADETRS